MPVTCPSCSSITLTAASGNTNCISEWRAEIFCTSNPFDKVTTTLQYSVTGTGGWTDILLSYLDYQNTFQNFNSPTQNMNGLGTQTGYFDYNTQTFDGYHAFKHQCGALSPFQENKTGYYRVKAELEYPSITCTQYSNSVLITIGSGNIVDLEASVSCGCVDTDSTYGTSAKLALNFQASAPTCPSDCRFESCPTLLSMSDGDIVYNLPSKVEDRSVVLFNINDLGPANSVAFAAGKNYMYWTSATSGYITEVGYQWPGGWDFETGATATSFKVGVLNLDYVTPLYSWGSHLADIPNTTHQLLASHRNRHINFNGSSLTTNYQLHTGGQHPNSIYIINNYNISDLAQGKIYPALFDWGGVTYQEQFDFGIVVTSDYDAGDSAGDLVGTVLVNLDPIRMVNPLEVQAADMEPMFMYPDYNFYDAANSNPGALPTMNAEVGITSGFDYKTYCSGDLTVFRTNAHTTLYSLDDASNTFTTGTSNHPCTGVGADCPPYYHSSDVNAPHASIGRLKILNRIEYVSSTAGEDDEFPSTTTAIKLRFANGSLTSPGATAEEGWYHIIAKDWNREIYNTWNTANPQTPAMNNGSTQHWASLGNAGIGFSSHQNYNTIYNTSFFSMPQYELFFENGTDTWRYGFNPLGLHASYGTIPYQVDEAGKSTFRVLDTTNGGACTGYASSCSDPVSLNFDSNTVSTFSRGSRGSGRSEKRSTVCFYCDKLTGKVEAVSPGDDGPSGDISVPFEFVSLSTTNPTYANWGDGSITLTVNRTAIFSDNFPVPIPNYRYKAVIYKVSGPGVSWTDSQSYIVAGGIQDLLTSPVVTFASTTYPSPLLLPEGHYSIKWSINVIDPGVYEVEECWWEYPVSLTADNVAPNPPIFLHLGIHTSGYSFKVQALDTVRSYASAPTLTPVFTPPTTSFVQCQEGTCLDSGTVSGTVGTNITLYGGGSLYSYKDVCVAAGHTWNGFDHIASIEDVTVGNWGNMTAKPTFTHSYPLSGVPYPNHAYNKTIWQSSTYFPKTTPSFISSAIGTLYPAADIDIKVTWESGFTKTFTLTSPIMHGRGGQGLNGWWNLGDLAPCAAEMWPTGQSLYNEPGITFLPYDQNATTTSSATSPYVSHVPHLVRTQSSTTAHNLNQSYKNQQFYKVLSLPSQAPTYPYEVYDGVGSAHGQSGKGIRGYFSTSQFVDWNIGRSLAANGTATLHAGMILGGFTGEVLYKIGHVSVLSSWFAANSLAAVAGVLSTIGTSTHYDDLITSIKNTTGTAYQGNITSPAVIGGVGTAGTLTDADDSGIYFEDGLFYAKDCPVCLTPQFDKACRAAGAINLDLTGYSSASTLASQDDGSCMMCEAGSGKLQVDAWDPGDDDPAHFSFYNTNPIPYPSSGPDLDVSNLIEGTGNILDINTGSNNWGADDGLLNVVDGSNFLGKTWYKIQGGSGAYLGYASNTTDGSGEILFRADFWGQFLLAASTSMGNLGTDFQVFYELFYYNTSTSSWDLIEQRGTASYVNGVPSTVEDFHSGTTTQNITYGHYKLRIKAVDTNIGFSGPLTTCFQDVYLNMRVRVCDTLYSTTDGIIISDPNERIVDPSLSCNCCPALVLSATTSGTGCNITQGLTITANCDSTNGVTLISSTLTATFLTGPLAGSSSSLGAITSFTGSPVTTGSVTATHAGPMALYGASYTVTSTYTGGTCDGAVLTSAPFSIAATPTCECQDPTALNYQTVYPNGNADCVGAIGGTNYSCCTYPTACAAPTVAIVSTACNVTLTATSTCSGSMPDTTQFFVMDVSATSNVWDANNPTYTGATQTFAPTTAAISWTMVESCNLNQISIWAGLTNGVFVILQRQTWTTTGYTIDSVSSVFTLGTGSNPLGTGHFPVVCGCTIQTVGSPAITATNYSASNTCGDGSCIYPGCMDATATNYNAAATIDDGSCLGDPSCSIITGLNWRRPDCSSGWCDPEIEFNWAQCDTDSAGNSIESPDTIQIKTIFSIDNGASWVQSSQYTVAGVMNTPGNTSDTTTYLGTPLKLQDLFTSWFNEGLIASPDIFDCVFAYLVMSTYPTAPNASSSTYSEIVRVLNPHGPNPYSWPISVSDTSNLTAGVQTNCHAGTWHGTALGAGPHASAGQPTTILVAPCGCTDDGTITPSTGWFLPTVSAYTSPLFSTSTPADNLMTNSSMGIDDGSCIYAGCMDSSASNYNSGASQDCTSLCGTATCCCTYTGCTDNCAINYDPLAVTDDGSCLLPNPTIGTTFMPSTLCTMPFRLVFKQSGQYGAAWGFTSVAWTVHFDPAGTNVPVLSGTTASAPYNVVTINWMDDCSTATIFSSGPGTYRFTGVLTYPSGCSITLTTDMTNSSQFITCDCALCPSCSNYNSSATCDDGSCTGCTDITASNYNSGAVIDDGSCIVSGCTDAGAANYNALATVDDGSCLFWHVWEECTSGDKMSFGGGTGPGIVTLLNNQVGLNYINPLETIGETFQADYWDGTAWQTDGCWKYIGTASGDNPANYTNPLNSGVGPAQWIPAVVTTTYSNCLGCIPVLGCIDPTAYNYNFNCAGAAVLATVDDFCCAYSCCDAPIFTQAAGHVDSCDAEYTMTINCNAIAADNADTITTTLQFWDGTAWQIANSSVYDPAGTDNITSHSITYHYNCNTDDFGGYGTGQYRIYSSITYSNGVTCSSHSNGGASIVITLDPGGCTDINATNYDAAAVCQCVTCLYNHCCATPVLTIDGTNGICAQSLECDIQCDPAADDGYTALWQSFATGSWVTIDTQTSAGPTAAATLTLANSYLHTASGTSENYRVVFTSDYTAPTPDCTIYSNILTVIAPILGCMDGGLTEYTVGPGGVGFGTPADGLTASNYDPTAECDDASCCVDGCTDALATNYNALATCGDGSCTYTCCTSPALIANYTAPCFPHLEWTSDFSACPATPTSLTLDWYENTAGNILVQTTVYPAPVDGTTYILPNAISAPFGTMLWWVIPTYTFGGTSIPDCNNIEMVVIVAPILGCTNPLSLNYNALATCDDGSCITPVFACTDPTAVNYNPNASNDDGSCIHCGTGCTDTAGGYSNYDATAICDCDNVWVNMGTCSDTAYYDDNACTTGGGTWTNTYTNNNTSATWNTCCIACVYGCTDFNWNNYNPLATCPCTELLGTEPCNTSTNSLTGDDCCCTSCIYGCTDDGSKNQLWWDGGGGTDYAFATGIATYGVTPNAAGATNFNSLATCEDGSCTYAGCTDLLATNYNSNLVADCLGVVAGSNWSTCCVYPATGCTDATTPAFNITPGATVDDGSCMYCDLATGNYEDAAGADQATWATGTYTQSPTTSIAAVDGSVFTSFTLTSVGIALQNTAEFLNGTNSFAIELYTVPTNCGASSGGTLLATGPLTLASSSIITNNFTGLPYGYYAVKLVVKNSIGTTEPTNCWVESCALIQATVCSDAAAANTSTIAANLQYTDNTLCIYPGYCACQASLSVTTGTPCSNSAVINATISCTTFTDISWSWQDAGGNTLLAGVTSAVLAGQIVSSLPVTTNATYTFIWDETSTPYATCPQQTAATTVTTIISCACTDSTAANYNGTATYNCLGNPVPDQTAGWNASPCCLSCIYGCMSSTALNYNIKATCDDGSCIEPGDGCCDPGAANFNSAATNCLPNLCTYCN